MYLVLHKCMYFAANPDLEKPFTQNPHSQTHKRSYRATKKSKVKRAQMGRGLQIENTLHSPYLMAIASKTETPFSIYLYSV